MAKPPAEYIVTVTTARRTYTYRHPNVVSAFRRVGRLQHLRSAIRITVDQITVNRLFDTDQLKASEIEAARWRLYWRAYMDITGRDTHPNDEYTSTRQADFNNWLDKVQEDPNWFIAPGVTAAEREAANLPFVR